MTEFGEMVRMRSWEDRPRRSDEHETGISRSAWGASKGQVGVFAALGSEPAFSKTWDDPKDRLRMLGWLPLDDLEPLFDEVVALARLEHLPGAILERIGALASVVLELRETTKRAGARVAEARLTQDKEAVEVNQPKAKARPRKARDLR